MEYEDIKDLAYELVDNPEMLDGILDDYSNESLNELYDELDSITIYEDPFGEETRKKLLERISKQIIVNELTEAEIEEINLEDMKPSLDAKDMDKKRQERLAESRKKLYDDLEQWLNGGAPPKVELTEEALEGYSINECGEIIRPILAQKSQDEEQQAEYTESELEYHIAFENLGTSLPSMTPEEILSKYDELVVERQRLLYMREQGIELAENTITQNNDMIEMIEGFASISPEIAKLLQSHKKSNEEHSTDEKLKKVMSESDTLDSNIQSAEELLHQYEAQLPTQDKNQEQG